MNDPDEQDVEALTEKEREAVFVALSDSYDDLLSEVENIIATRVAEARREGAAEALEAAAAAWTAGWPGGRRVDPWLRARAAALREPTP